ncbi:MAG: terpene cyclase/mutase family protein [Planctomycetes bacterium]|nr:terpene cyclase/mutase family protein [Planctomycetota bacterium]
MNTPQSRRQFFATAAGAFGAAVSVPGVGFADDKADAKKQVEDAVDKGLAWLKTSQAEDGHWEATNGAYHIAMTGLAGMALMMEGSNLKEGKYSDQIRKAVEWLQKKQQQNGLLAHNQNAGDFGSYMHGHGFATMFLASAYGESEDKDQQDKLEQTIKKAAEFSSKAQSTKKHTFPDGRTVTLGGWGYTSAAESGVDEGSITVTQLQALRAARNAGINVPRETIDKSLAYLEACTTPNGGLVYSYVSINGKAAAGAERPPLTVAAVAGSFSAGQYKGELAKKWIKFCKEKIPVAKGRIAHDEYQSYYFAQFMYVLGDDRYGALFPKEDKADWLTWTKYKEAMYPYLIEQQDKKTGAWNSGFIGPVFGTSVNLAILQLDKAVLPIYQR